MARSFLTALLVVSLLGWPEPAAGAGGVGDPVEVTGVQYLLVVPVRFPDVAPAKGIREITGKVRRHRHRAV